MSTTFDDLREMNEAPKSLFAGFLTRLRNRFGWKKPAAGSPENVMADGTYARTTDHVEPTLNKEGAQAEEKTKNFYAELMRTVAKIWQQATVDQAAFENIKHLKDGGESNLVGTVMLVNNHNVCIYLGINPDSGDHEVMSASHISPQTALDHVFVAMTDDLMRKEGIDQVRGTDLDKALLCLAAEKHGLKINNMPELSDEVKAQAQKLWDEAFPNAPEAAVSGPAASNTAGAAANNAPLLTNTEILPADKDAQPTGKPPSPQDITDVDFNDVKAPAAIEAVVVPLLAAPYNDVAIPMGYIDYSAKAEPLPDDGIPVLTDIVTDFPGTPAAAPKRAWEIRPEALSLLAAQTPEDTVSPATFTQLVDDLKAGKFSDADGMLSEDAIRNTFTRSVRGTTEAEILLQAIVAQGVVYNTTKTTPALRMLVNPHVSSPVSYDQSRKASTLNDAPKVQGTQAAAVHAEVAPLKAVEANDAPVVAAQVSKTEADEILAEAGIGRDTYDQVKNFVQNSLSDTVSARDLAKEFAKAGVGSGKARKLLSALHADGITKPTEASYHIVRHSKSSPSL